MKKGICINCGKETSHFNSKTCSDKCKEEVKNKKLVERQKKRDKELLEELGREEYEKLPKCSVCGIRSNDLIPHITHWHKMELQEYKDKYTDYVRFEVYLKGLSDRAKGDKNPVHKVKDKQELSPYSYKFYMKKGYDEETSREMALTKARKTQSGIGKDQRSVNLEYWLKKTEGDEDEAKRLLSERQSTFSKEKCFEKYGEEEGLRIWQERQDKWMETLESKSDEEKKEINRKKLQGLLNQCGKSYSKISQELFWGVYEKLNNKDDVFFATLNDGQRDDSGENNEYKVVVSRGRFRLLDFYIPQIKCCIEFQGDYWHSEKFRKGNKERDSIREEEVKDTVDGIKILHINENEYRKDKEGTINKCLEFINES